MQLTTTKWGQMPEKKKMCPDELMAIDWHLLSI